MTQISIFAIVKGTMIDSERRPDIGHTPGERHLFFVPLFGWASEISDPLITRPLEILLNQISALWSRAERNKEADKSVDQEIVEFMAYLEQVEQLLKSSSPGTVDFKHLNNILIALRETLLAGLKKRQRIVPDTEVERAMVEEVGPGPLDSTSKKNPEDGPITIEKAFKQLSPLLKEIKDAMIKREIREGLQALNRVTLEMLRFPNHDEHGIMAQARAEGLVATIKKFYNGTLRNENDRNILRKMEDQINGPVIRAILSNPSVKF